MTDFPWAWVQCLYNTAVQYCNLKEGSVTHVLPPFLPVAVMEILHSLSVFFASHHQFCEFVHLEQQHLHSNDIPALTLEDSEERDQTVQGWQSLTAFKDARERVASRSNFYQPWMGNIFCTLAAAAESGYWRRPIEVAIGQWLSNILNIWKKSLFCSTVQHVQVMYCSVLFKTVQCYTKYIASNFLKRLEYWRSLRGRIFCFTMRPFRVRSSDDGNSKFAKLKNLSQHLIEPVSKSTSHVRTDANCKAGFRNWLGILISGFCLRFSKVQTKYCKMRLAEIKILLQKSPTVLKLLNL